MFSVDFSELKGQIFDKIYQGNNCICFEREGKTKYTIMHQQDCCENVYLEDVCGDLSDLENAEITYSERMTNRGCPKGEYDESSTWTFIKLASVKGWVDIRFYGTSNGYYSESANLYKEEDEEV